MIKKKLIEVALPLDVINKAAIKDKGITHGHPSTLHTYWARRPSVACRAVLFAQLVDDPSSHPDKFPTIKDQSNERNRLFKIIEELVKWENNSNLNVLKIANDEIQKSCQNNLPIIWDPFSGGGTIPLEAQRLGLSSFGSDLNPLSVLIGKATLEIPVFFNDKEPIHPNVKKKLIYNNLDGFSEDVKHYAQYMKERAFQKIGNFYPKVRYTNQNGTNEAVVIAWIWTRTIPSPDPALNGLQVPLVRSFDLSKKKGKETWIIPKVNGNKYSFEIGSKKNGDKRGDLDGTVNKNGGICLVSKSPMPLTYIREQAKLGNMGQKLMAIIAEEKSGQVFLPPSIDHENIAFNVKRPEVYDIDLPEKAMGYRIQAYGMKTYADLFTDRQLLVLNCLSELINDVRKQIHKDALASGLSSDQTALNKGGFGARAYAEAISVYLAFGISRSANYGSSLTAWGDGFIVNTFGRQALPMVWDFAEGNPFSNSTGNFLGAINWITRTFDFFPKKISKIKNKVYQQDAQTINFPKNTVISTDPPYYDNIGYADLSDFFYMWLKQSLKIVYPELFSILATPKAEELVASPFRHGDKENAERFFLSGMKKSIKNMAENSSAIAPTTIYYAFKQTEIEKEGISSTGWATFLEAVIEAGYSIVGTWPMRLERITGLKSGKNVLATSVVLVCRKREDALGTITRAEFVRQLKIELPDALANLKAANISPADIPQSSIGPGIGIFSRYQAVLENDDSHMSVKTALQLINRELGDEEGEYDSETSFAITWFEQNGFNVGDFGSANNIANAKGISVNTLVHSGVAQSSGGRFSLLDRASLEDDWNPTTDKNLTIWECCQYLIKTIENKGEFETAKLMKQMGSGRAESAKELAYTLYDIAANKRKDANEATAYNGLIAVWSELTAQLVDITEGDLRGDAQMKMI